MLYTHHALAQRVNETRLRRKRACSDAHYVDYGEGGMHFRQSHDPVCPLTDCGACAQGLAEQGSWQGSQVRGRVLDCRASCACRRHHDTEACLPSPCNLGLSCLTQHGSFVMSRPVVPCPSVSVLLHCCKSSQRDLVPAPACPHAVNRP
jgi:hypothetical protein